MSENEQWKSDLEWLLENRYPGRGGYTALADDLDSDHVTPVSVHHWATGKRKPNYENRRALLLLRERISGEINKGGGTDGTMDSKRP